MTVGTVKKLPKLDFLRAVSAASVVLSHLEVPGVPAGFGVLAFFVISGFLITHLLINENERTGDVGLTNFYIRRSLRIFPAFYIYWAIAVADMAFRHRVVWAQALCSFFYVNNYYQGLHGYPSSLLSHTWSLGVEEQFYLLWPGLFLLFRNELKKLAGILAVAIPCLWVYRVALHFGGVHEAYVYTAFETRVDAILVGCLLALVLHTGIARGVVEELRRGEHWLAIVLIVMAASMGLTIRLGVGYRNVIGFAIDPVLVAILVMQLIAMSGAGWMDSKVISYLGRISYSTYLYQEIVIPALSGRLPRGFAAVGCLVVTWGVAAVSYEVIEKPFLKLKERFKKVPQGESGDEVGTERVVAV